jgi:hypothetical protein
MKKTSDPLESRQDLRKQILGEEGKETELDHCLDQTEMQPEL